jgi:hypothetical protein
MHIRNLFEVSLQVTHRHDFQVWAALLETSSAAPLRLAGRNMFPATGSLNRLLAMAIISALGGVTKKQYQELRTHATRHGQQKPRLLIKAFHGFASHLKTILDGGTGGESDLPYGMLRHLANIFAGYFVTVEGIDGPDENMTSAALTHFAARTLFPERFSRRRFLHYGPQVVSALGALSSEDLNLAPAPLTPDLISQEEFA